MKYPTLYELATSKQMVDTFLGYNHNLRIAEGEFYDMKNLTADHFPMLASRRLRGSVATYNNPAGLIAKDALAVVDGSAVVYNGYRIEMGLSDIRPKQLVSMGAYMVIFPDKKYLNTADTEDFGSLEASWEAGTLPITYAPCSVNGELYENTVIQGTEPTAPANGDYWVDTSSEPHTLMQYSSASAMWVQIPTVYTRISATGIGALFMDYDGVTISGCSYEGDSSVERQIAELNATKVIYKRDEDYIIVVGMLDQACTQTGGVRVKRSVPDMDYVCEAGNRLWGCKYGLIQGEPINEIYGSKLGDFKNWNCFMGISTDSWAASVGSDGQFTAAVNYLGHPTFFKENVIHTVMISSSGAHQIQETNCSGVQKGSWLSPVVAGEILYYKGLTAVYAYDGSQPVRVSDQLGSVRYRNAVAGSVGGKYYISMQDDAGAWHLFCLDTAKGLWVREDDTQAVMFAAVDEDLYFLNAAGELVSVNGWDGVKEDGIEWEAVSGVQYYRYAGKKYVSRYNFRIKLDPGASVKLYIQYDSSGEWEERGTIHGGPLGTVTLPVVPRRCDHLQFKLVGNGEFRLFSIARVFEEGSDV